MIDDNKILFEDCPVKILQDPQEFAELIKIYTQRKPENVLEVGSFFGGTLYYWIKNNKNLKNLTSIDSPIPPSDHRYEEMMESRDKWKEWTNGDSFTFHDLRGRSEDAEILLKAGRSVYDFIFIDGGHEFQTVLNDFIRFFPMLRIGGIIAFHDIHYITDVGKAWERIKNWGFPSKEIINKDGGFGIGIIYK
ncbi:MAG: class I SAM-dependent methyltransferase [Chitinophagaceae bacterium]